MKRHSKLLRILLASAIAAVCVCAAVAAAGSRNYRVKLVDEEGEAIAGATVQFESGTWRKTEETGSDGSCKMVADADTYGVRVLAVPDGYLNDPSKSYQVGKDKKEIEITVKSIDGETFRFTTADLDGNTVTSDDFKDAKLILVNFWEPWCGPCISEMPDLVKLYEKYKDRGFVVLGVSTDTGEDAESVAKEQNITYPLLASCKDLSKYSTMYVPTSVFVNGEGKVLSTEAIVGARSEEEWEDMILQYLGEKS